MKLELKHLAHYLPYKVKIYVDTEYGKTREPWELGMHTIDIAIMYDSNKMILHPLSDLSKSEYDDFKHKYSLREIEDYSNLNANSWGLECGLRLFEMHFDVFGLIEKGLAIDINTLK